MTEQLNKFDRRYYIDFEIGTIDTSATNTAQTYIKEEEFRVSYPITVEFEVQRRVEGVTNSASFRLFNLSQETRNKLWLDERNEHRYIKLKFYAGYGSGILPLVFTGRAVYSYSYKKGGDTEWITEIPANDFYDAFLYGFDSFSLDKGTELKSILSQACEKLGNIVNTGYITNQIPALKSKQTFIGNTFNIIKNEHPDFELFADLGEVHLVGNNEVIPSDLRVITSSTGLLGTPKRRGTGLVAEMVFEPRICLAQAVALNVESMPNLSGNYKVLEVRHSGIISPNVCGHVITSVSLSLTNNTITLEKESNVYKGQTTARAGFIKPVEAPVTSHYGWRTLNGKREFHYGVDFGAAEGTPVKATANGIVFRVGYDGFNGWHVFLNHGKIDNVTVASTYIHLKNYIVQYGQQVTKGQVIGYVGATGSEDKLTGAHLDFRIKENGVAVNPKKYIGVS